MIKRRKRKGRDGKKWKVQGILGILITRKCGGEVKSIGKKGMLRYLHQGQRNPGIRPTRMSLKEDCHPFEKKKAELEGEKKALRDGGKETTKKKEKGEPKQRLPLLVNKLSHDLTKQGQTSLHERVAKRGRKGDARGKNPDEGEKARSASEKPSPKKGTGKECLNRPTGRKDFLSARFIPWGKPQNISWNKLTRVEDQEFPPEEYKQATSEEKS